MTNEVLQSIIENEGAKLYDVEVVNENSNAIYRVYIVCDGGVNLDLCAKISNILSPLFDLEPPIKGKYFLEVSSPGLERKLKKSHHFQNSLNELVKITLLDGEKFDGLLKEANEEGIEVENEQDKLKISYDQIHSARTYVKW